MTGGQLLKCVAGSLLVVFLSSACAPRSAPSGAVASTPTPAQAQFPDPFLYCAAVGTIDAPDARYVGPAVPGPVIKGLRKLAGIADDAPDDVVAAGTVWRCKDGHVWACFVGANLPCSKANTSATPQSEMIVFCKKAPTARSIPAAVTGHETIYDWRCVDGTPRVVGQRFTTDAQGFVSDFWYELPAPGVVVSASRGQPRPTVTELTARDSGSAVTLRVGDALRVALEGNPTTGYTWGLAPGAGTLLQQEGDPEFEPYTRATGSGGTFTLRFKAIRQGKERLKLIYHRTFEPNVPPLKTFEVRLAVRR